MSSGDVQVILTVSLQKIADWAIFLFFEYFSQTKRTDKYIKYAGFRAVWSAKKNSKKVLAYIKLQCYNLARWRKCLSDIRPELSGSGSFSTSFFMTKSKGQKTWLLWCWTIRYLTSKHLRIECSAHYALLSRYRKSMTVIMRRKLRASMGDCDVNLTIV